jgi:hypothetical protein
MGKTLLHFIEKNGTCPVAVPTQDDFALNGSVLTS